jgi:hypothetical protein
MCLARLTTARVAELREMLNATGDSEPDPTNPEGADSEPRETDE